MKKCCNCKETKSPSEFYANKYTRDGLSAFCKKCHTANTTARKKVLRTNPEYAIKEKEYKRLYRLRTVEQRKQYMKEWRERNPNRGREYYLENKEAIQAYRKEYVEKNKAKILAKTRKRQAAKLNRTPKWVDAEELWLIEEAYALARLRTEMTGIYWHVDHVIPLQGRLVSGLHTISNLQVIPALLNYKKNNRYEVDHGAI